MEFTGKFSPDGGFVGDALLVMLHEAQRTRDPIFGPRERGRSETLNTRRIGERIFCV
jgi:hypothetical protein